VSILFYRWRVFQSSMQLKPENVDKVVLAACTLHNLLIERRPKQYLRTVSESPCYLQVKWKDPAILEGLQREKAHNRQEAKYLREYLADYYNNPAQLRWQNQQIRNKNVSSIILHCHVFQV